MLIPFYPAVLYELLKFGCSGCQLAVSKLWIGVLSLNFQRAQLLYEKKLKVKVALQLNGTATNGNVKAWLT